MKNFLIKYIASAMIITGLFFAPSTPLLSPMPKAEAQTLTWDIPAIIQNIIQWVSDNIWQVATSIWQYFQEFLNQESWMNEWFIKPAIKMIRKELIDQIKTQTIQWVNTGFKGKPLFMTDPSQMAKNMATEQLTLIKKQVLDGANGVANELRYANKEIARSLVIDERSSKTALSKSLTPTKDKVIAESICSDENQLKSMANKSGQTVGQVRSLYCGTENSKEKYDALSNCFASDFNCGGWGAFLSLTQNPVNDDQQRLATAKNSLNSNKATEEKKSETELISNGGFFSMKSCAEYAEQTEAQKENGDPGICTKYKSDTPGAAVKDSLTQVVQDPISQLQLDDDISSALTEIASAFISYVMTEGISSASAESLSKASAVTEACMAERQTEISDAINGTNRPKPAKSACNDDDLKNLASAKDLKLTEVNNASTTAAARKKADDAAQAGRDGATASADADAATAAAESEIAGKDAELKNTTSKLDGTCQGTYSGYVNAPSHEERISARNKALKAQGKKVTGNDAVDNAATGGGGVDGGIYMEGPFNFVTDVNCRIVSGEFIIWGYEYPRGTVSADGSYYDVFDGLEVNMKTVGTKITGIVNEYSNPFARGYMQGTFTPVAKSQ